MGAFKETIGFLRRKTSVSCRRNHRYPIEETNTYKEIAILTILLK